MVNLWYKLKYSERKKRLTLHRLGVGFVFFIILFVITKVFSGSLCLVKNIFGISCFGCGLTRAFISILKFEFKKAFEYNVLGIPLFISIVIYSICALIDIFFDKNYVFAIENQLAKKYMYFIYVIILIISVILNNIF